jgi:hypothetical protein
MTNGKERVQIRDMFQRSVSQDFLKNVSLAYIRVVIQFIPHTMTLVL